MQLSPSQLATLLEKTIPAGLPVLITGAPGVGKSNIVEQAAQQAGADLLISHPAVADPTDAKGLPWPVAGASEATFLPFGELARAIAATRRTVWLLEDLGQAPPAVQASFMQLILARRVNGHILPDHITFIAATNRRTDRAGVTGILEPVKSRFCTIVELTPSIDDWCQWAFNRCIDPILIAFLRYRSELLCQFTATADLTNSPVPRTWQAVNELQKLQLPAAVEMAAFSGAVGEGAAVEFVAFRKMAQSLTSIDQVLIDPASAKIPKQPSELYAVAVALAARANTQNFARIAIYAQRLVDASKGEFAVLMMRDATRRDPKLVYTDTWVRISSGPIGQMYSGQ
jgi:hypothetical protein